MSAPLSVDDLFTVGVSFDLLGGYLLGRGLLTSPLDIARRNLTFIGANPPEMVSQIEARADGEAGLVALLTGFLLQAAGYVALIGGADVKTGGDRAVLAVALGCVVAAVAWLAMRRFRQARLRRLAIDVARANAEGDRMEQDPDGRLLILLGEKLGYPFSGDITDAASRQTYAREHFGIERVSCRTD